ncbi:Major facilitator superfamily domain, general substrate transporter [Penicillium griseofulvum]|uniref:Major facilitator superfamily domain, general substrate transporter n=1 Tax=Penicillium patulum TaxID=5078 RepID=A0A135LMX9_PENPA|nr:Major facilitator superfamily domain, general substrate transporter [Penicillium griseofulvum]KXG50321.1 Major facilitator superfamily domain, general substrate transporter [Penicillium griseofulvum]
MSTKDRSSLPISQPYTIFTRNQIRFFTYLLGYLTLASSLTATIYFPLIDLLSNQYNVSTQLVNLTITFYVIFQAISPAFWSPLSDTLGPRPVFIMTFSIYVCASLGLALNKSNYTALILLRGLQSIGGSAVMSLAYAVVADISPHSERGKILGPMLTSTNLGPCIGPVIGGGSILASGDAMWCFWALVIFGMILPETARTVVGNGAVDPQGIWRTWWTMLRGKVAKSDNNNTTNNAFVAQ